MPSLSQESNVCDTTACPHCGAEISAHASFCRHCGSSESDGWSEEAESDLDEFDYDQFVADNFSSSRLNRTTPRLWRIVAILLLSLFLLSFLFF